MRAALAAAALATAFVTFGRPEERPARIAVAASTGSFTQANSRAGAPIFAATGIAPGRSAAGSVTITNSGGLGGWFALSETGVTGALASRLILTVRTGAAVVYSGRFDLLGSRPLGWFAPGQARTYVFTAAFPHGPADNPYMATSAAARFVWQAVEGAPVPAPDGGASAVDRDPPRVRVSVPRRQRVLERRSLAVDVRCSERCRLRVSGELRPGRRGRWVRLAAVGGRLRGGQSRRLRLRIPRGSRRSLARALRARRGATVRLRISARDGAGNNRVVLHTVRLRGVRR